MSRRTIPRSLCSDFDTSFLLSSKRAPFANAEHLDQNVIPTCSRSCPTLHRYHRRFRWIKSRSPSTFQRSIHSDGLRNPYDRLSQSYQYSWLLAIGKTSGRERLGAKSASLLSRSRLRAVQRPHGCLSRCTAITITHLLHLQSSLELAAFPPPLLHRCKNSQREGYQQLINFRSTSVKRSFLPA